MQVYRVLCSERSVQGWIPAVTIFKVLIILTLNLFYDVKSDRTTKSMLEASAHTRSHRHCFRDTACPCSRSPYPPNSPLPQPLWDSHPPPGATAELPGGPHSTVALVRARYRLGERKRQGYQTHPGLAAPRCLADNLVPRAHSGSRYQKHPDSEVEIMWEPSSAWDSTLVEPAHSPTFSFCTVPFKVCS